MSEALVSIVIPCYNHQGYVVEAIKSVIAQDYRNIELIVIDDGSTDGSVLEVSRLSSICCERFVRYEFRTRANKGLCATLNEGVEWCRGQYYSAIASDDVMLPQKTTVQVSYLERVPGCVGVFGGYNVLDGDGRIVRVVTGRVGSYDFSDIILRNYFLPAPTQMIRLPELRGAGEYPTDLIIEDWYMWLRLSSGGGGLHCLSEVLSGYRRHDDNLSKKSTLMKRGRRQIIEFYKASPLYKRALSVEGLVLAREMLPFDRIGSFRMLIKSVCCSPSLVMHSHFFKYFAVLFIPHFILNKYL